MPLYIILGHGTFHPSDGYMTLPQNVQIDFVVPDGSGLDDEVANSLEFFVQASEGNLSAGLTDEDIEKTKRHYAGQTDNRLKRLTIEPGAPVKNYKLESVIDASAHANYRAALEKDNVLTPGKKDGNTDAVSSLQSVVLELMERHGPGDGLIRIEWIACRSERPQA